MLRIKDIPTEITNHYNLYAPIEGIRNEVETENLVKAINRIVGGCTVINDTTGFWVNDKMQTFAEKSIIIDVWVKDSDLVMIDSLIYKWAELTDQDYIGVMFNGVFKLIKTDTVIQTIPE